MNKYYFTYGSEGHPFKGGWTEVYAPTELMACVLFRMIHPDVTEGIMNFANIYPAAVFEKKPMFANGNFGAKCHEIIKLTYEVLTDEQD